MIVKMVRLKIKFCYSFTYLPTIDPPPPYSSYIAFLWEKKISSAAEMSISFQFLSKKLGSSMYLQVNRIQNKKALYMQVGLNL